MSDTQRSTAEFQRPRDDAVAATAPRPDTSAVRQARRLPRAAALWQGADERGGDPYNATGRHAMGSKATPA
ncbi:MAG: hypothetical protein IT480_04135 [Gammaproteobacteria bacterium]|nr:hypothetical protein [Gammaproteobacteria bacterium]